MYIDDKLEDEVAVEFLNPITNNYPVKIGRFNTSTTRFFEGQIDEISISKVSPQYLFYSEGDLDFNHVVDIQDLLILVENWLSGY